jgi:energy-coupling factor transporter ATP-binding protein EcfA2
MIKKREITIIFGRTGSGKTFLVKKLIEPLKRVIIIDALNEYTDGIIFYNIKDFAQYFLDNPNLKEFRIICRFHNFDLNSDMETTFNRLFDLVFHISNLTLVIEEAEIYISSNQRKSVFNNLVKYGRHKAISIIAVARRVTELSNELKSQLNIAYSSKQILQKDIDYLKILGFKQIENLPQYEFEKIEY